MSNPLSPKAQIVFDLRKAGQPHKKELAALSPEERMALDAVENPTDYELKLEADRERMSKLTREQYESLSPLGKLEAIESGYTGKVARTETETPESKRVRLEKERDDLLRRSKELDDAGKLVDGTELFNRAQKVDDSINALNHLLWRNS